MEKIAVFVNDAEHARGLLQPLLQRGAPAHWILVACPPALTRHIGRFVSKAARAQWQARWATALVAALEPDLKAPSGSRVETMLARRPLAQLSARLEARWPGLTLLDARRPRIGAYDDPIAARTPRASRWRAPVAATLGLSALLALAD